MATFSEDIVSRGGLGMGGGSDFGGTGMGLVLGLLLGRGGLLGNNNNDGGCVTPEMLNQQTLGDIKAAIPYNEAQVQLALAQAVYQLRYFKQLATQYGSPDNLRALQHQAPQKSHHHAAPRCCGRVALDQGSQGV